MRITPLDIRKQEFRKAMRGLDGDEVYAFLNTVADEYEAVLSDNKNLREKIVEFESRLNEYRAMETNLRNTLVTAEKLMQEAKENARREAGLIIREAEMEAEKASEGIRSHTSQLRREIFELKKNKDNYITRLRTLLDSHRKMLEGFEEDFAGVDQAIEKIGQQVEEDVRKGGQPTRMSRDKITQEFGHDTKDKVTWGDERRREDERRPVMPRPGGETPDEKARPAEDANLFAAPGGASAAPAQPGRRPAQKVKKEPVGGGTGVMTEAPPRPIGQQAETPADVDQQPAVGAPGPKPRQDDWRGYEVRQQPTDWKSYEIEAENQDRAQARGTCENDVEVESALSSLKEVTEAAAQAAQEDQWPQATVRPQAPPQARKAPAGQQAPAADASQPAEPTEGEQAPDSTWSMEDLRKNLSNLSKDEGH
jgi:cell division initiation protein